MILHISKWTLKFSIDILNNLLNLQLLLESKTSLLNKILSIKYYIIVLRIVNFPDAFLVAVLHILFLKQSFFLFIFFFLTIHCSVKNI